MLLGRHDCKQSSNEKAETGLLLVTNFPMGMDGRFDEIAAYPTGLIHGVKDTYGPISHKYGIFSLFRPFFS